MRHSRWLAVLFLPVLVLLMGARSAPLVDPDPVAIPEGMSAEAVQKEIKRALVSRTWTITDEQPGRVDATLNVRAHVVRIAIDHDAAAVRVAYVSSENLNFKEKNGKPYIHKNYGSWINNLVTDISRNLQLEALN